MKRLFSISLVCLIVCTLTLGTLADGIDGPSPDTSETVTVSNAAEFAASIASNRTVLLAPGVYNMTRWLNEQIAHRSGIMLSNDNGNKTAGLYFTEDFDGYGLVLSGFTDLTIASADPSSPAEIVCEPRYVDVLRFADCSDITLENLVLGHTPEQGICAGNVLSMYRCERCCVSGCDLYGCGAYGLYIHTVSDLLIETSIIHDCTYGCGMFFYSDVKADHCTFTRCKEYSMFEFYGSRAAFNDCGFTRLIGSFLSGDPSSSIEFSGCTFDSWIEEELRSLPLTGISVTVR